MHSVDLPKVRGIRSQDRLLATTLYSAVNFKTAHDAVSTNAITAFSSLGVKNGLRRMNRMTT